MMKGRVRGAESRGLTLAFGDYGLKSLETCRIDTRALEAARIALTRHIKRGGRVWIRVFPDKPFTKKPAETRMGKGKGSPEGWVACVRPGQDSVRDGRRRLRHGKRSDAAGGAQAADQDNYDPARGGRPWSLTN